ncbi:MAG: Excinuclease subunit domain protein [Herbinix sp.]|jgi:excinuclease ABC subunit C|nr:Excinuclease subunit domain protein [Herbinix sp.]
MIKITNNYKDELNTIPELPGIYRMIDSRGTIIYIGKSKCLKKRVKSYFCATPKWEKVKKMVSLIDCIEYIVTDTHLEARLLECELIKTHKPVFNSQMKNDRNYVYLKIEEYNIYNSLTLVEHREDNTYGPFRRKYALNTLFDQLKNIYPVRLYNNIYDFEYHIFPTKMDAAIFHENQSTLINLLSSEHNIELFISCLGDKMIEAASLYKYEMASLYRDIMMGFQYLKNGINGYKDLFSRNILLKIPIQEGFKLFYVSKGNILLKQTYASLTKKEIKLFVNKGNKLSDKENKLIDKVTNNKDEKAGIDFRDILYSEIMSLSDDLVIYLN